MSRRMIRRLAAAILQILAVSAIAFFLFSVVPGDFYSAERVNPQLREPTVAVWRKMHGLNRPWPERYGQWLASCATGKFGVSLSYGIPVGALVRPRIANSAAIIFPAWLLGWLFALTLALWATRRHDRALEPIMSVANMAPEVILVSVLTWIAVALGAPLTGAPLPMVALLIVVMPLVFLHAMSALAAAREANFVRLAESRGIASHRLWTKFMLPAAANPLLSLAGPSLAAAVGSSLVIEAATGWPGLGSLFLEAVQARDYEVVQSVVLLLAILLTFTNLVADLLLYRLDPRIRLNDGSAH